MLGGAFAEALRCVLQGSAGDLIHRRRKIAVEAALRSVVADLGGARRRAADTRAQRSAGQPDAQGLGRCRGARDRQAAGLTAGKAERGGLAVAAQAAYAAGHTADGAAGEAG